MQRAALVGFWGFLLLPGPLSGAAPKDFVPPPFFEPNYGQAAESAAFVARAPGYLLLLQKNGDAVYGMGAESADTVQTVRMQFLAAQPSPSAVAEAPMLSVTRRYSGGAASRRQTDIPNYRAVKFRGLYPAIDALWKAGKSGIEYEFQLAPGADPQRIRIAFPGARRMWIDGEGALVLATPAGILRHQPPSAFQIEGTGLRPIPVRFEIRSQAVGFSLGPYDRSRPLVIDPVLQYSSYLGGSGYDAAYSIATDAAGNLYAAGETASANFPLPPGGSAVSRRNRDAFVTKLNPDGAVLYTTILASSGNDAAHSVAVDQSQNAFVVGVTAGDNFPVTAGALSASSNGQQDAFVARLDASGRVVYCTYLGGPGTDVANGVAVDANANTYITGYTSSPGFPTTAGAPQSAFRGGFADAFLAKLNASGSALIYSTLLGGTGNDIARAVAVGSLGSACIAGSTDSRDLTANNGQPVTSAGNTDILLACLNPAGTAWNFVKTLGGTAQDDAYALSLDRGGAIYIAGTTCSPDFPTAGGTGQIARGSSYDAFVTKMDSSGAALMYSTIMGGSGADVATALAVDSKGQVWIAGYTTSPDFPLQSAWQTGNRGAFDAFVAALRADGSALLFSSFLGGAADDRALGLVLDNQGGAFVAGYSASTDFPVTAGARQKQPPPSYNAFVAHITDPPPVIVGASPASGSGVVQTFTATVSDDSGTANLQLVNFWMGAAGGAACNLLYEVAANRIFLLADSQAAWLGPLTPGAAGTLANSQCTLNAAASAVTPAGDNLSVKLALTFTAAFRGSKELYLWAQNYQGLVAGWQKVGNWTVVLQPPVVGGISPASGSGVSPSLTATVSDNGGAANLQLVNFWMGAASGAACNILYDVASNRMSLLADSQAAWLGPLTPGAAGTLANSQCILNAAVSSVSSNGNALSVKMGLTFTAGFSGAKDLFLWAQNRQGLTSGWQKVGAWTVVLQPPSVVGISPNTGKGSARVFTATVADNGGAANLQLVNFWMGASGGAACNVLYEASSNLLWLLADSQAAWLGPLTPGSPGTLANSQCTLNAAPSAVSSTGIALSAQIALTFTTAFRGDKEIYLWAQNQQGLSSGWQKVGKWSIGE